MNSNGARCHGKFSQAVAAWLFSQAKRRVKIARLCRVAKLTKGG